MIRQLDNTVIFESILQVFKQKILSSEYFLVQNFTEYLVQVKLFSYEYKDSEINNVYILNSFQQSQCIEIEVYTFQNLLFILFILNVISLPVLIILTIRSYQRTDQQIKYIINRKSEEHQNCAICLNEFKRIKIQGTIRCGHYFHKRCLQKWLEINNSCPMCRYKL